jgi:dimethylglycine dehydrogenase
MRFWAENGTPQGFGHELFPDDLDRIMDNVMRAVDRVPVAATAGVKRVINGPMIWSPDANALFGPVPELKNYFSCNGIIPGFSQSGGLGLLAAEWIIEGEPKLDIFAWDLARFGDWADKKFTKARVEDQYTHRFKIHFPNEERSAGRPARLRPAYEMQKEMGAVFGLNCGWEHPLWFADKPDTEETNGFTRQNWFEPVGKEVNMLRNAVGVIDISNFANYMIKGHGAADWLNALLANNVPKIIGRSCLSPLIGVRGGIAGDFTVTKLADDEFMMVGSGMAERYHTRFFNMLPLPEGTTFELQTNDICGFNVAGPKSRQLLQQLSDTDFSTEAFPFMRSMRINVAGIEVVAIRVSFTGDLGWELHCDEKDQAALYSALITEAKKLGGGPVGGRALGSLRIEKGYGSWGREYSPEYFPNEVGLERLVKMDKDFLHKSAYAKIKDNAPRERLSLFELTVTADADATGGEPIFTKDGKGIGRVTSGAYGYSVGKSLALGFIKEGEINPGDEVDIFVLGKAHKAILMAEPPFDPEGRRLRD